MTVAYSDLAMLCGFCNNSNHESCVKSTTPWFGKVWTCPCSCNESAQADRKLLDMAREMGIDPATLGLGRNTAPPAQRTQPLLATPPIPTPSLKDHVSVDQEPLPLTPPDHDIDFAPTKSGRYARGELEYRVKQVCDEFAIGAIFSSASGITPVQVSERIDPDNPPSVGAIGAVFDRWNQIGFAETAKSPVRFVRYTDDGLRRGYARIKAAYKRAGKSEASEMMRRAENRA